MTILPFRTIRKLQNSKKIINITPKWVIYVSTINILLILTKINWLLIKIKSNIYILTLKLVYMLSLSIIF